MKKITGQAFSELGKRNFGRPTCLAVAASIIIGTSKGLILVFDYHQTLKSIIGPGTKAIESGAITSLAISADHTTVAGGHASGNIFTWEIARSAKPFLHIPPLDRRQLESRQSDSHVSDVAVLHLGFLGTRHTALVSADEGGMAFSHLATRGLGAVGRTVKTTRILGRYPPSAGAIEQPRKSSSVLAFSPLPLGNVEQPTDSLGLTALLTPYLLVIVSTTPIAETQHKMSRPKEVVPHSTLSGCLAWFPAVKLKGSGDESPQAVSKTKLVYCWSNVLTVLDVETSDQQEKGARPTLHFRPRSRWRAEEAIVAVQWISRSVLGVLTISQRLIILEDNTLRMTDSFDLIQKHIFHQDLFSRQLHSVVEQLDEHDDSMHGVVADAFYMSFRAYKGRLFLLGFNDVSIGTLSNWADRLLALMEEGDYIAAIELATSYYNGDADKLTVGLPSDDVSRHALVQEKLLEMISASLRYTFSRKDSSEDEPTRSRILELASASFSACLSMEEMDFLFEEVYEAFQNASSEDVFFEILEPYIVEDEIASVPPDVLKDMITQYASQGRATRLEEMICHLDTSTIDINQVTILCRQFSLYDALIYVWTRSLRDYITPLIDLLTLIKVLLSGNDVNGVTEEQLLTSAMKIFPFLAYTCTGRIYPGGATLPDDEADESKDALYSYVFSGKLTEWPRGSGDTFQPLPDKDSSESFPYLRAILRFDTPSFMSMLNEAFEDSYLNGDQGTPGGALNGVSTTERSPGRRPTRQYILNILLGVMSEGQFESEDTIYLYMFVARNLPKFPQYIILPGSALHKLLEGLCDYPSEVVADDCQLSVEYLLSVYHPTDIESLVPLFEKAGFYRVLKSVYSGVKQYARLVETYLNDTDDRPAVFECIRDCLRPGKSLNKRQISDVHAVILSHALDLANIDASLTARTLRNSAPELLKSVLDSLDVDPYVQFLFLRALLEPDQQTMTAQQALPTEVPAASFVEQYVQLMCKYDPTHVADYVGFLRSGDLRLDKVLPAMESSGVVDAAVVLMAQDGLIQEGMTRLIKHLGTLETALVGLLDAAAESPDKANTEEAATDLLEAVHKYTKIGIWLCQGQTRNNKKKTTEKKDRKVNGDSGTEKELDVDELLWLDLIDTAVAMTKSVSTSATQLSAKSPPSDTTIDTTKITNSLRTNVQQTFSALLACMAASDSKPSAHQQALTAAHAAAQKQQQQQKRQSITNIPATTTTATAAAGQPSASFLRILRAFLTRAARTSPSLSDLRNVLASIFAAYTFEETLISLANRFLEKDVFEHVEEAHARRQRGWRPKGQVCEGCRGRVWGPGAGSAVWDAWERKREGVERERRRVWAVRGDSEEAGRARRGKGKADVVEDAAAVKGEESDEDGEDGGGGESVGNVVVFACRHLWHQRCLVKGKKKKAAEGGSGADVEEEEEQQGREFKCPMCEGKRGEDAEAE